MSTAESHSNRRVAIDELDRAIVNLSARINAASYELLVLIRRFDERAGWLKWGFGNCAEWLAWRCDLGLCAAREKVRVANALKTLPGIAQAFSSGGLSYSKVRALTRVAEIAGEDELLAFAVKATAVQVEERCHELRCGSKDSIVEAVRANRQRALYMRRNPDRGTMTISVELPLEQGELIAKALDKAREATATQGPEFADEGWAAIQADALVTMATCYLPGQSESSAGASDNYTVTVHVDQAALAGGRGRSGLPIDSVRRLACDSDTVTIVEDEEGEPLSIGRKTRTVPTAIKRALWARDKGCVFPGCPNKRFVDAHHVRHWSDGGETSLDNLMLLCTRHHTLMHEGGFSIDKDYRDRWFFKGPDGRAVPQCGYHPDDMIDDDIHAGDAAHASAEGLLSNVEKTARNSLPAIVV